MPRRHSGRPFGQAKPDVPRWRRGQAAPAPQIKLSRQQEQALVARLTAGQPGALAHTTAPKGVNKALATTGAYRFRYQLVPVAWLAGMLALGLGAHAAHGPWQGAVLGLAIAAAILVLTRHTKGFARKAARAIAALTALWVPVLSLLGPVKPLPPLLLACWLCVLVPWVRHYRVRQEAPAAAVPVKTTDYEIWAKLSAKRNWHGHLGMPEELPGGGRRYPIILDGAETDIGEVMGQPRKVAAAYGKPMTEAYVEPSPDGVESRGSLTLLRENTLEHIREWDGSSIDPQTGMAVIGRFSDGAPIHVQFFARRDGISHFLAAGTTGSGKTGLLSLLLCLAVTSGLIVPVLLDPQQGQSFPKCWRQRFIYARGVAECMSALRGVHAGMLDRSRYLGDLTWTDDDGTVQDSMEFFDPHLARLPIILPILDESPALLKDRKYGPEAVELVADIGKRGRKAGVAEILAAGVPSLAELGDQALRDMLVGGNVACLRTANKVSAGMVGLEADPSVLPKHFRNMEKTYGLGFVVGPDGRQAPGRIDLVRKAEMVRIATEVPCAQMDPGYAAAMDRAMAMGGVQLPMSPAAPLAAVPPADEEETAPGGRTAADAILAVLEEEGGPLERGEIVVRTKPLVKEKWGRGKEFSVKAQGNALAKLAQDHKIQKTEHGTYAPVRASLHVVSGNDHAESEATGA